MFVPRFGRAPDYDPDIFGFGLTDDYYLGELLGVGGGLAWKSGLLGHLSIRVSAYFRATEFDDSVHVARLGPRRFRGRARVSGRPQSMTASAEGSFAVPGASKPREAIDWRIAFLSHANDYGGTVRENGVAVSLSRTAALGKGARLTALIEFVRLDNFDNEAGYARHYLTGALAMERGKWRLSGTATWRREHESGANGRARDDVLATLSLGYGPVEHFEISAGYRHSRVGGLPAHTIGIYAVLEF